MFLQLRVYGMKQGINDNINPFPSCQFCGGNKVAVPNHQNDLIDELPVTHGGDIKTQPHIDPFLPNVKDKVLVRQVFKPPLLVQQAFQDARPKRPGIHIVKMTQPKGKFSFFPKTLMQVFAENSLC